MAELSGSIREGAKLSVLIREGAGRAGATVAAGRHTANLGYVKTSKSPSTVFKSL